ncbi:MAG: hypothetical protein JW838_12855 [Spirochaetes bacterium]|nr:hypothetical protein [Spirochaetota bacterium]
MKRKILLLSFVLPFSFFLCIVRGQPAVITAEDDRDEWVRLEIKEAFVSRQTHIDFRDSFSGAEFGWHVMVNDRHVYRGMRLYSTLYYPSLPGSTVRLMLTEVDVLSDDIVSGVDLADGVNRYEMNKNGDWVLIKRTPFRPDSQSGPDSRPGGARLIDGDSNDSVSFLGGDFTDYLRVPAGSMAMVIAPQISLVIPDDTARVLPTSRGMKSVKLVIPGSDGSLFRLRGAVGTGTLRYRILFTRGDDAGNVMLDRAISYLESTVKLPSLFTASDMAHIFNEYDRENVVTKCKALQSRAAKSPNLTEFCKTVHDDKK